MVLSTCAMANQYPGQAYWHNPSPGQWNYQLPGHRQSVPATSGQRRNTPYGNTWPSQQTPGYQGSSYYSKKTTKPLIETKISTKTPYVQQHVILKLSVVSQNNLLTVLPHLPATDSFLLNLQEGPVTHSRTIKGKHQIVNDFYYELTPLKPGQFEIPAIRVSGEEQVTGYQTGSSAFEVSMRSAIALKVREANPSSEPWLPAEQLNLKVKLPDNLKPAAGKPLPMTIEVSALGISGNKLPSLEDQLSSDAFRVYRDSKQSYTYLDKKSNRIVGRRLETFTLVPQYGGDLTLPQLSINWWSTRTEMAQRASVPLRHIAISGSHKQHDFFDSETSLFPTGTSAAFWIPLSVAFGIIFGYWMALWISHRKAGAEQSSPLEPLVIFFRNPMRRMAPAFSPLKEKLRSTTAILNPVTRWQRWRRRLVLALPLSVRFYYCVRFVDEESDPEIWGYTLRFLANKHLNLPTNAPYSVIAEHILDFHPKAEPLKIKQLIHELEETIYGHNEMDFEQWKEAFKHEIRPSLKIWNMDKKSHPIQKDQQNILPNLNPENISG